jgi:cystathionine beta-synthase
MLNILYGDTYSDILSLIGNTPLLRLQKLEGYFNLDTPLYAKLEFYNPGGSVKDRIALYMLSMAVKDGLIKPGGVIIEPTSGNTGIGLAIVSKAYDFKLVFTMPKKMSMEKELILEAYGGYVIRTPTEVSPSDPLSYYSIADALRNYIWSLNRALDQEELRSIIEYFQMLVDQGESGTLRRFLEMDVEPNPYAYIPNQYFNKYNPIAHYETTGREIWRQTGGDVDIVFAGIGTGGTITGIARYLKEKRGDIKIIGIDPEGSVYHHIKKGLTIKEALKYASTYKVEGIGEDILPDTVDIDIIDDIVVVDDQHSFSMARLLARLEGLLAGGSSGSALYGAIKYIKDKGIQDKYVVVILPDTGRNYLTRFYSDEWMTSNGFEIDDDKVLRSLR